MSAVAALRQPDDLTLRHTSPHSSTDDDRTLLGHAGHSSTSDDSALNEATAAASSDSRLTSHRDSPLPPITPTSLYRNDAAQHAALLNKITYRIMPFLLVLYTFSFLDRSNLSNVHKSMLSDIHLTEAEYGTAAGIFFVPYMLLEIPSNMILERVDARRWLARIIGTWGCISTLMLAITNFEGLCMARFLLGVAESGFFPGIIFYLTLWFTPAERAQRLAFIFVAQPLSGILGGLLAYPILTYMHGVLGMAGWRWVFFLEGTPTVFLGVLTWFYLPATPMEAAWLSVEERVFLTERMRGVERGHGGGGGGGHHAPSSSSHSSTLRLRADSAPESIISSPTGAMVGNEENEEEENEGGESQGLQRSAAFSGHPAADTPTVRDSPGSLTDSNHSPSSRPTSDYVTPSGHRRLDQSWKDRAVSWWLAAKLECISLYHTTFSNRIIYLCIATNFLILMPVQSITFYLPSIVSEIGVGNLTGNLVSAIPYSFAGVAMFVVSHYSDRTGLRAQPILCCNILGFLSLGATAIAMSQSDSPNGYQIVLQLICLSSAAVGIWACKPALMALFTTHLPGNSAVAIAAVTTFGNFSGILAPAIMSGLRSSSGSYATGCLFLMGCLVVASWTVAALNREINMAVARKQRAIDEAMDAPGGGIELTSIHQNGSDGVDSAATMELPEESETRSKLR